MAVITAAKNTMPRELPNLLPPLNTAGDEIGLAASVSLLVPDPFTGNVELQPLSY